MAAGYAAGSITSGCSDVTAVVATDGFDVGVPVVEVEGAEGVDGVDGVDGDDGVAWRSRRRAFRHAACSSALLPSW